jgi:hypothetical protein
MPKHEDLDFDHRSWCCDDCWDQEQRGRLLAEMHRANDLKQAELYLRESGEWVDPKRGTKPRYIPPPPLPAPKMKGGMSVEPRRRSAS